MREGLLVHLFSTSEERARRIAEATSRNPDVAELLIDLGADDDLRTKLEIALLHATEGGAAS